MDLSFDMARLPNLPWTVWPETKGAKAIVKDACNNEVATIHANTREHLLEIAAFLEEVTRSGK